MKNKEIFIKNLHLAYQKASFDVGRGFAQRLAKHHDVTPQAVYGWLDKNQGYPKIEVLRKIREDTNMPLDELLCGKKATTSINRIPLLDCCDIFDYLNDPHSILDKTTTQFINVIKEGEKVFALTHKGSSMISSALSIPDNALTIFDAQKQPLNGDLVLAKLENGTMLFRKLIDEGERYLMPLNSAYNNYSGSFSIIAMFSFAIVR